MILQKIKLSNFQSYKRFETTLSPLTFIKGKNGIGKTTLGVDAVLFCLFGYTKKTLSDLPTRDVSKSCSVELSLEFKGDRYVIQRKFPSHITIKKNGDILDFSTGTEANKYLQNLFGDSKQFQKFRMVDNSVGINFLEEGPQTLKKILFSTSDQVFNDAKESLNGMKQEREIYNKDKAVIYSHFPSKKRLQVLQTADAESSEREESFKSEIRKVERDFLATQREISTLTTTLSRIKKDLEKVSQEEKCYVCKQNINEEKKESLEKSLKEKQIKLSEDLEENEEIVTIQKQKLEKAKADLDKFNESSRDLSTLILKLKGRLKQKDYVYTNKDVEIIKRALKELDNLSTRYLVQSIQILEPIINSVLEKALFSVKFEINDKGKFNIVLFMNDVKYNYKDLSAGQRLLLQIAFKMALLLEKGEEGIIVADEGMSNLDEENLLHVLNIFDNYPFQLIFMLHRIDQIPSQVKVIDLNEVKYESQTSPDTEDPVEMGSKTR